MKELGNVEVRLIGIRSKTSYVQRNLTKFIPEGEDEDFDEIEIVHENIKNINASRMDPTSSQPASNDDDTVTYQQLYGAYLNFWNSLNDCVSDEYKLIPENGTRPTYREAKNLWKAMKQPRQRKLLWVTTGFLHGEFPNDEAEFRREKEAGLINETNVTDGADEEFESSSDDDDIDIDLPDMNDENIPPVGAGAPQNALERLYGGRPAELQDISSDEESPQDRINANAITLRPAILEGSLGDADMSVQEEISSTDNAPAALASLAVVATIPPIATPAVDDSLAAAVVGNEVVEDSQMDDYVDAFVETVQDDYIIEEPDLSPPRSLINDSPQISALSDSPVPTPQSTYSNSQIPTSTVPKEISPPKKRRIIETDDESDVEMKDSENDKTSYIDEQIASPEQNQAHTSKPTKENRRKKPSPKPSTSKPTPRVPTRSAIQANKRASKIFRKRTNELDSDDSEDSVQSNNSVLDVLDSHIVSDGSDTDLEISSLDGFIQLDDSVFEEESSDENITMSDSRRVANSEDPSIQSTLNVEIYTHTDSGERDLPATVPRATVKNAPSTPKTTPLFAHLGKSRYSS
uniref:Uncharacterized protein n=1 Tax=Panagrolaimus sp. PS1159 TaxID=55785 RepID=A0AC35F230_9BILA